MHIRSFVELSSVVSFDILSVDEAAKSVGMNSDMFHMIIMSDTHVLKLFFCSILLCRTIESSCYQGVGRGSMQLEEG